MIKICTYVDIIENCDDCHHKVCKSTCSYYAKTGVLKKVVAKFVCDKTNKIITRKIPKWCPLDTKKKDK